MGGGSVVLVELDWKGRTFARTSVSMASPVMKTDGDRIVIVVLEGRCGRE